MTFGQRAKQLRNNAGLSQRDMAKALGYKTNQFVSNIERDLCFFPVKKLTLAAKIFSVSVKDLFEEMLKAKLQVEENKMRAEFEKMFVSKKIKK